MTTRIENLKIDLRHDGDFRSTETGDLATITGIDNINQRLFHRLITVKGTLVHRPEYGVGVKQWQNQIANIDNKKNLALRIKEQYLMDEGVESFASARFVSDDNGSGKFSIIIKYTPVGYGEIESTFNPFSLEV